MKFVSSVLTRRDLQHSGGGLALNWPMCRDRHPSISQFWSYLATKFTKLGGNVGWQGFQEVARGWGGNEGIRIGQGIRFQSFSAYLGPWGVDSAPFFIFGVSPWVPIIFPIVSLFPRCGCAVLCTYFCPLVQDTHLLPTTRPNPHPY